MRALALTFLITGCVHPAPPPSIPPQRCPAVEPAAPAEPPTALHDLQWQLRVGQDATRTLPDELQAFTVGRWECALGKVQMDDGREPTRVRLLRTRRLACTHANGTTVTTSLACDVTTGIPAVERSLPLALDTAPPLNVTCTPIAVERLQSALGPLCTSPSGVTYCATP
jgi:hypothetical protein